MASSIRVTSEGIEGSSPDEIRRDYIDMRKPQYDAVLNLILAAINLRTRGALPEELKLSLKRVEKEFSE